MSEINSIANGTFTLGSTSATNFEAGPGITITQPSEGTVRIANDETVLYEGAMTGSLPVSATLSEAPSAFEYVQVHMGGGYKSVYTYEGSSDTWQIFSPYVGGSNISLYAVNVSVSNKTMTVQTNRSHYCKLGSNGITNYDSNKACTVGENTIKKVVGINRINGGNE